MNNPNLRFDIRDRDVEARGAYDPRFDKKRKPKKQPPAHKTTSGMQQTPPTPPLSQPAPRVSIRQPQSQPVAQPPSPQQVAQPQPVSTVQPANRTIVTGDSVATGIGHGGAKGNPSTDAAWGRGSAEQLAFMQQKGAEYYRGANVILSSGVLNSGDMASVEAQLKFLIQSGAKSIRLAGAPMAGRFAALNPQLKALAQKYGIHFIGPYASQDGVHPLSYTNYQ